MTAVRRLNHAVLYVHDARTSSAFYQQAFEFEVVGDYGDGGAVFMRASNTENHHDLGLLTIGAQAPGPERGRAGLYHLAWEVDTIQDLAAMRERLLALNALVGESDHGVSKSLYGQDVDGNEFEVMWAVPRDRLVEVEGSPPVAPLDLDAVVAQFAG